MIKLKPTTGQQMPFLTAVNIDDNMDAHKDILYQGLTQIVYALDIKLVMPSHYKKPANQSVCTIVAI